MEELMFNDGTCEREDDEPIEVGDCGDEESD